MRRFLIAVILCALTAVSGAWTLQWDSGSDWPTGTTVTACLNNVCVNGITGNSQSFSEVYPPGTVLHGTAQAVPPVGYQCGDPLAACPPSAIAEIAQTFPSDQSAPNRSAWTASTTGGNMAGFGFVAGSFVSNPSTASASTITATTTANAQSGDVILAVLTFDSDGSVSVSSVVSTNTTWTEVTDFRHTSYNQGYKLWQGVVTGSVPSGSTITATLSGARVYRSIQTAIFRSDNGSAAQPVQLAATTLYAGGENSTLTDGLSVTVSPTGSNALTIVEILEVDDFSTSTSESSPGTGYTQIAEGTTFTGEIGPYLWAIKTGASAGSQNVTATYTNLVSYNASLTAVVLEGGSSSASSLPIGFYQHSYSALLGR